MSKECPYHESTTVTVYDRDSRKRKRLLIVYTCYVDRGMQITNEELFKDDYEHAITQKWDDPYDGMVFYPCPHDCD